MISKKVQQSVFVLTIINTLFFILLTILAMTFYPGGTPMEPDLYNRYVFFENFFSDLGRITVFDGAANTISRALFVAALIILGLTLTSYFIVILPIFKNSTITRILSILGSISGIVAAINFILLGIVSLDMNDIAHGTFTFIAFIATVIALIFYTIVIFKDQQYPNYFAWIFIVCTIISITYVVILFGGGTSGPLSNLGLQAVSQKIVVYVQILTFTIQAIGSLVFINNNISSKDSIN